MKSDSVSHHLNYILIIIVTSVVLGCSFIVKPDVFVGFPRLAKAREQSILLQEVHVEVE